MTCLDYILFLTGYDPKFIEPAFSDHCQPVKYTLDIKKGEDLSIKVIKSKCACIELPELDIRILPGLNSQDLICDVFGLLNRIETAIKIGHHMESWKKNEVLEKIEQLKDGRRTATLVLIDPTGLSLIMGGAEKEILNT